MKAMISIVMIGLALALPSCETRSIATKEPDDKATRPNKPDDKAVAPPARPLENNSFAAQQVYSTDTFRFDVPTPWFYATPDTFKKKNVARCFLNSRLRVTAEGLLLVDAGKAVGSIEETVDGMIKVMRAGKNIEISQEEVAIDGDKAIHVKSDVADYNVPCSVIVNVHNETLYLIMMSVSKSNQMKDRDLMVQTLLKTWKWKGSTTSAKQVRGPE